MSRRRVSEFSARTEDEGRRKVMWGKLKSLFTLGGGESIRQAMRKSYEKHRAMAESGQAPISEPPHHLGLFGALGTRYKVRGLLPPQGLPDMVLWPELSPFPLMPQAQAVEALAEYVVWQECRDEARVEWLREAINGALRSEPEEDLMSFREIAADALVNGVAWLELLHRDVDDQLRREARG